MERVQVRVVYGSLRGKGVGGIVGLSRRDARLLTKLGRVEAVDTADPVEVAEPTRRKAPKRGTPVKRAKVAKSVPKAKRSKKAKSE